jgi:hypothetical protein
MKRTIAAALAMTLPACSGSGVSSPSSASPQVRPANIDVLDYLVGDQSLWPRVGSFSQNQVVDPARHEVCWVKYANPKRFECWTWDDQYVYHEVDHAIDGDLPDSYHFTDGRWMPRFLSSDWQLDVSGNRIVWFDGNCQVTPSRSGLFPYRQRVSLAGVRDTGTDLGVRDVLLLEYQPYDPVGAAGELEQFYFARGAGWYEWDRGSAHIVFSRAGGPTVLPRRDVICPAD